jgi:F-type H+-transporting ATPase subunit b
MMDINITLLGQMITFAVFVWFTMKFIWPPIIQAMRDREKKIADGLQAAERGQHELELAQHKATEQLRDAKLQAAEILDAANKRGNQIVEEAKERAREEGERLLVLARNDVEQEMHAARQQLRSEVAKLAVAGAEKILRKSVDAATQRELVNHLIAEI